MMVGAVPCACPGRPPAPGNRTPRAAAILVTSLNFPGTMTLPFVLVASIVLPLILIPTAKRLGGRGSE
jgi:hypothetical protein